MRKLRSVKIIHNISDRLDFLFLAEFFHFCGLYVGEEILGSEQFDPLQELEDQCFDIYICVSRSPDFYQSLQSYEESDIDRLKAKKRFIFFRGVRDEVLQIDRKKGLGELSDRQKSRLLTECMGRIIKRIQMPSAVNEWKELIRIYVANQLMLHSSSLQYYPRRNSDAVKDAGEGMMAAYEQLNGQNALLTSEIGDYARYARIWCAVKANEAYEYQNKALYFEPQDLAEECERLIEQNPDFSNTNVLIGLCYEHSKDKAVEAISAFQTALKMERTKCYSSSIYYWIGKRFEAYESRQEEAEKSYREAYNKKKKFRNIYKLAMYAKNRGQYENAEQYYTEILSALKEKKEKQMQDPLELEYAFKAYQQMCVMFYDQCDDVTVKYQKIISYAESAIAVREEEIDASSMYVELYGEERAGIYREISKDRMSLSGIYRILSSIYSELHESELSRKYRDKIM